jgi:hypothetical protein
MVLAELLFFDGTFFHKTGIKIGITEGNTSSLT